jgi:hypothetical protein
MIALRGLIGVMKTCYDRCGRFLRRFPHNLDARNHRHQRRERRLAQENGNELALVAQRILPPGRVAFRFGINRCIFGVIWRIKRQCLRAIDQRVVHPHRNIAAWLEISRMVKGRKTVLA